MKPIRIFHFSDVLCVWAYIAQIRLEELKIAFPDKIAIDYHFVPVFGNAREKLEQGWRDRGGLMGYQNHVKAIARYINYSRIAEDVPPLVMSNGDPYIRALMRTISANESSGKNSYSLLYGGGHIHDFSQHPNQCIPIKTDVNRGKCSTASGRYQFLTSTWIEKASKYHPNPSITENVITYSFEPEFQDIVVYRWLKDHHQWDVDILTLLKKDRVEDALTELSDVWTSLGSGIESNLMTPFLPKLYRKFLAEELASTSKVSLT